MHLNFKAVMYAALFVFALMTGSGYARKGYGTVGGDCPKFSTENKNLNDLYCDQPLFINLIQKNELTEMLDNVCLTFFPQPDNPNTYNYFLSRTYCDGSNEVISYVATDLEPGVIRVARPMVTYKYSLFGYAGCDTNLIYRCREFGVSDAEDPYILGLSTECRAVGLSCLRKIQEIVAENNIPDVDLYVLPNKLPNRCVTQRQCFIPNANNEFYKAVGLPGPVSYTV